MCSLVLFYLFSLYTKNLLRYKNRVIKRTIYLQSYLHSIYIPFTIALFWNFGISIALLLWRCYDAKNTDFFQNTGFNESINMVVKIISEKQ